MQEKQTGTVQVKRNFPEMLKGGVICDVVNAEQAKIPPTVPGRQCCSGLWCVYHHESPLLTFCSGSVEP